uniref:C2 domain-containing protein n=1 Tax=Capra hircus TaxID=9925 RepID=A0A8C2NY84_CAPHI
MRSQRVGHNLATEQQRQLVLGSRVAVVQSSLTWPRAEARQECQGSLISINSTCTEMGNFDNANVTGEIEFAIRYCLTAHSLEICIRACKNLAFGEEKKKKCNPYVKTYLLPDRSSQGKRKTSVQKNTVEPTFQETLKYQVELAQLASRQLQVSVWHLGVLTRRVFLGEVIIPLATWDFEDRESQSFRWYPLRAKAEKSEDSLPTNNGELTVRAKLVLPAGPRELQEAPEGTGDEPSQNGQLCLVVLGAKNLPVRSDGTLNSFVKGCLTLPDQQRLRLKSPVLKKQACPQWKHSFVFKGVTPSQLRQSSLELTIWDQATFGVNDRFLGGARLGSKEDLPGGAHTRSQAKLQWQKVLSSPNVWTDMTLILH